MNTTTMSAGDRPAVAFLAPAARTTTVAALVGVAALHAAWGAGSSWPMASRNDLTEAVLGAPGRDFGGAAACYAVTGALATAAALVAGWPSRLDRPRRIAVLGIAAGFAVRGALGLAGHTNVLVPISTGARFRRLDRRIYSPVVLTLAGLTALSLGSTRGRRDAAVVKGVEIAPSFWAVSTASTSIHRRRQDSSSGSRSDSK